MKRPIEGHDIAGRARVDTRTKRLIPRLQPGEIAVIDHEDIDQISAEGLVRRQVKAVINASASTSGRYPNLGPLLLASAGVMVVDEAGPIVMNVPEGTRLAIHEGRILRLDSSGPTEIARGNVLELEALEEKLDETKKRLGAEIERFAENTIEYIRDERDVVLEAARLPEVKTDFHGRHVLIVVRGYHYKEDLKALRAYVREVRPLLVGVDGGADAILDFGLKPDLIIGDMDSVTTEALQSGAEVVVHAYPGGRAPGLDRIEALGLDAHLFEATGNVRGHRDAARVRTRGGVDRCLGHAREPRRVPGQGTQGNGIDLPDQIARRPHPRGRKRREPSVQDKDQTPRSADARGGRVHNHGDRVRRVRTVPFVSRVAVERHPGPVVLDQESGVLVVIDFRFFIISIVAVFLALGLGIVVGSGFFRDPILTVLENRVDDVLAREEELRSELLEIEDTTRFPA